MGSFINAAPILAALRDQASKVLASALDATPLETFAVGDRGTFPYNWQDPVDAKRFNRLTYEWIAANLKAGAIPLQQDASFAKLYAQALGNIAWRPSRMDQAYLNQATNNAVRQGAALIQAWTRTFGVFCPPDEIAGIMATTWVGKQPTSLMDIQSAPAPYDFFDLKPAAGAWVIPPLLDWLNALGRAITLQNSVSLANAYLRLAMEGATRNAWTGNGLTLNDGALVPRYQVMTQTPDIRQALLTGPAVALSLSVKRRTSNAYGLSISDGEEFSAPIGFLTIGIGDNADYFASDIAVADNQTTVTLRFPGVNLVRFGPVPFERTAPDKSWYWAEPILEAIKNDGRDVPGFSFKAPPDIDFSRSGPFAHIKAVAISAYPTITIGITAANWQKIGETLKRTASSRVDFLGIKLAGSAGQGYSNAVKVDAAGSGATITLSPPQPTISGTDMAARAWVFGVQPDYPAA